MSTFLTVFGILAGTTLGVQYLAFLRHTSRQSRCK